MKLLDAVRSAVSASSEALRVALVAEVVRYDDATGRADVRPIVPYVDDDGRAEPWPTLYGVPVMFPGGGDVLFSYAVAKGSEGLVVFHDLSLAGWKAGDSEPRGRRSHALADGVFLPGIAARGRDLADDGIRLAAGASVIELVDGRATVDADNVGLGSGARDGVVRKADLQAAIDGLKSYIDAKTINHTHSAPGGATGNGLPVAVPPPAGAAASTKVTSS